jgi:choline-phosphate cytidylyltransferase
LDRTQGVSSSEIRAEKHELRIGLVGESVLINKFESESHFVNGVSISGVCTQDDYLLSEEVKSLPVVTTDLSQLIEVSDALYIVSHPTKHYIQIKQALMAGKHVLCESPIALNVNEFNELQNIAAEKKLQLIDSLKTAYSMAYNRMILLLKGGVIGDIISVDAVCTSLSDLERKAGKDLSNTWNSICAWGPTAMLPIFQLLGTEYISKQIASHLISDDFDIFTKIAFIYPHAVASLKVGKGVKSEGELLVSGTKGYVYVPAPWWKTDYFEVRFENPANNKRYFYQLDGEGIRYEIVSFLKIMQTGKSFSYLGDGYSKSIVKIIESFYQDDKILI